MTEQQKIAVYVGPVNGMRGEAGVYRLDPPLDSGPFVVVSAVDLPIAIPDYRTSETMVFPSDGKSVTDWGELGFAPYKSHVDALLDMGYALETDPVAS